MEEACFCWAGGRWSLPVRSEAVGGQDRNLRVNHAGSKLESLAWRLLMGHLSQPGKKGGKGRGWAKGE